MLQQQAEFEIDLDVLLSCKQRWYVLVSWGVGLQTPLQKELACCSGVAGCWDGVKHGFNLTTDARG